MDPAQVIEQLAVPGRLPVEAIRAAQANRETMVPVFLRTIDDFLELKGPVDPNALFFIFHLLGEWREKSAYWPLAVFLRLPPDVLDTILGDCITETSHRVMAAVFDGDPAPLYDIIRDPEADEFVRAKMCQTIAMLTRRGELRRDATAAFLRDCFAQLEPQQDCYVWSGWLDAVAWLGLNELKPLVQQAFLRGSIDPMWLKFKDFEEDLQYSVDHPDAEPLNADGDLTLFGETVAEMSGWAGFQPKAAGNATSDWGRPAYLGMPHRDPLRKVGRNDPCPCGSGKKFKKCCLTSASAPLSEDAPPWEATAPYIRDR
ncbi:DUF1186 domain-containing protein [Bradyrhizobium sediminis]|uniref:DUF1186 domain-containing protein n=1 Tax=Bradyrhizobium sediminis TaxID=2840469 RepID=A0A975N9S2_9BRAD|nr:DUF1186 domain-containing protein [Bradyrhizobium sediminis]QWG10840.1 DUF1186 domain-containing protein [Bradyrhizobium sediminis]